MRSRSRSSRGPISSSPTSNFSCSTSRTRGRTSSSYSSRPIPGITRGTSSGAARSRASGTGPGWRSDSMPVFASYHCASPFEWATNQPGGYTNGEAQWYDANTGSWVGTGADLFFRVYGVSGPSLALVMEPNLVPVDPGTMVPLDVYFNNSGNEPAATARIEMSLDAGLVYQGDDAANEGGVQVT